MEVFDRAAAAGATLLRVERIPAPGGDAAAGFVLTFDVGHVFVHARTPAGNLEAVNLADRAELEENLVDASEEEPWWRILGSSLARSRPAPDANQVRLQFTIADARPRTLRLASAGGGVRATIEAGD